MSGRRLKRWMSSWLLFVLILVGGVVAVAQPVVNQLSVTQGSPGDTIRVFGSGFQGGGAFTIPGPSAVLFDGQVLNTLFLNANELAFQVPLDAVCGTHNVQVANPSVFASQPSQVSGRLIFLVMTPCFNELPFMDYGDAPEIGGGIDPLKPSAFPTLRIHNGPRHRSGDPSIYLGEGVTFEPDAVPFDGLDNTQYQFVNGQIQVTVWGGTNAPASAYLNVLYDWEGSCDRPDPLGWSQADNHIVRNQLVPITPHQVTVVQAPLAVNQQPIDFNRWTRITLSPEPITPIRAVPNTWDGRVYEIFSSGETEDHCGVLPHVTFDLTYQPDVPFNVQFPAAIQAAVPTGGYMAPSAVIAPLPAGVFLVTPGAGGAAGYGLRGTIGAGPAPPPALIYIYDRSNALVGEIWVNFIQVLIPDDLLHLSFGVIYEPNQRFDIRYPASIQTRIPIGATLRVDPANPLPLGVSLNGRLGVAGIIPDGPIPPPAMIEVFDTRGNRVLLIWVDFWRLANEVPHLQWTIEYCDDDPILEGFDLTDSLPNLPSDYLVATDESFALPENFNLIPLTTGELTVDGILNGEISNSLIHIIDSRGYIIAQVWIEFRRKCGNDPYPNDAHFTYTLIHPETGQSQGGGYDIGDLGYGRAYGLPFPEPGSGNIPAQPAEPGMPSVTFTKENGRIKITLECGMYGASLGSLTWTFNGQQVGRPLTQLSRTLNCGPDGMAMETFSNPMAQQSSPLPFASDAQEVASVLDVNNDDVLNDAEILEAVRLWITSEVVPGTQIIIDEAMLRKLIDLWIQGGAISAMM